MSPAARCVCPDCGGSHARRKTPADTVTRPSMADATDLALVKCPHCAAPILAGRIDAQDRRLDPDPLTELGVLAYRPTARVLATVRGVRGRNLSYAWRWPPPDGVTVHVEHQCGKPVPRELREVNITRHHRTTNYQWPDTPPF